MALQIAAQSNRAVESDAFRPALEGEVFSGVLVPLVFRGSMRAATVRGFAAMNHALKARAEAPQ